jgi:hypothetical protein
MLQRQFQLAQITPGRSTTTPQSPWILKYSRRVKQNCTKDLQPADHLRIAGIELLKISDGQVRGRALFTPAHLDGSAIILLPTNFPGDSRI